MLHHSDVRILIALLLIFTCSASAQNLTAHWTAPTTGSPVDHYVFILYSTGDTLLTNEAIADTFYVFPQDTLTESVVYRARVAGVDSLDRQGNWSIPSDFVSLNGGVFSVHTVANINPQRIGQRLQIAFGVGPQNCTQLVITDAGDALYHSTADSADTLFSLPNAPEDSLEIWMRGITNGEPGNWVRTGISAQ